jgi:hypothetical protein
MSTPHQYDRTLGAYRSHDRETYSLHHSIALPTLLSVEGSVGKRQHQTVGR